jgi:hypothetical protein
MFRAALRQRKGYNIRGKRDVCFTHPALANQFGFAMELLPDGGIRVEWRSGSINVPNPSFQGDLVPPIMRQPILDAISTATSRTLISAE